MSLPDRATGQLLFNNMLVMHHLTHDFCLVNKKTGHCGQFIIYPKLKVSLGGAAWDRQKYYRSYERWDLKKLWWLAGRTTKAGGSGKADQDRYISECCWICERCMLCRRGGLAACPSSCAPEAWNMANLLRNQTSETKVQTWCLYQSQSGGGMLTMHECDVLLEITAILKNDSLFYRIFPQRMV